MYSIKNRANLYNKYAIGDRYERRFTDNQIY